MPADGMDEDMGAESPGCDERAVADGNEADEQDVASGRSAAGTARWNAGGVGRRRRDGHDEVA
ncbi:hypothetical protein Van01_62430 [Micromonospora andamanensis]|uniref:Uncharacterized protein n=1 Tax=Micromonospora andamanensis TaxID=1287068 RepID=A0ABQ4I568_9ACTN|nr:hypothetical protein Van01_62430 [Micromonospora andamanensis]